MFLTSLFMYAVFTHVAQFVLTFAVCYTVGYTVGYLRGNSLKYRWRMRYKSNPVQDMEKAQWYEKKLMQFWLENQDELG